MGARETATAAAKRALKVTAAVADEVRRPAPGVVFLVYHRVGGRTPMSVDLPAELFDEQMAWLAERGTALAIDEALEQEYGAQSFDDLGRSAACRTVLLSSAVKLVEVK